MDVIYTVTCIGESDNGNIRKRVWGWYASYYEAEEAAIENITNMNEAGWYPWIVIEQVREGILPITNHDCQTWFLFEHEDGKYHKIDRPKQFDDLFNWSIG